MGEILTVNGKRAVARLGHVCIVYSCVTDSFTIDELAALNNLLDSVQRAHSVTFLHGRPRDLFDEIALINALKGVQLESPV